MTSAAEAPEVLVLTPDFPPGIGGIQTLVSRVCTGFTRFRPRVVTIAAQGATAFDREQRFPVVRTPAAGGHRTAVASLNALGALEGLRRRPTVVLSAHIVTGPAALAVGRLLRRPVVQYTYAQELSRRRKLARRVIVRADLTVAISRYGRELAERCGGRRERIRIVPPGVDCGATLPTPPLEGSSIVVVARLTERYKGHDMLLRALVLVRRHEPAASLQVVGDGPLRPELERLAHELGLGSAAVFHGALSDGRRNAIVDAATVFAMPSRIEPGGAGEGFGLVYVEAGAHGLPVVAGNEGGAVDAVVDGETGILVDPESPEAIAEALLELLQDRERARRMGTAGWERARSLSWEHSTAELEEVLAEAAGL